MSNEIQNGEHSYREIKEALLKGDIDNLIKRHHELELQGIPDEEIHRVLVSEFTDVMPLSIGWKPDIEIGQGAVPEYTDHIPSSKYPPESPESNIAGLRTEPFGYMPAEVALSIQGQDDKPYEPYLSSLSLFPVIDYNIPAGIDSELDSQPSMHNEEGWVGAKQVPEWSYVPEQLREAESIYEKYVYTGHDNGDICAGFHGKIFDLTQRSGRPIPPSEGLGYTNTHPNCQCYWEPIIEGAVVTAIKADEPTEKEGKHLTHVNRIVAARARAGTLHTVKPDGTLSQRTRKTNPIHELEKHAMIREALMDLKQEFKWLTDKYQYAVKQLPVAGKWYVVRAATEAITDHRAEGEPYRRLLEGNELHALARTAIGKSVDINHNSDWNTASKVYDSEYDLLRKEIQMLVHVQDPEIIGAIDNHTINAVSINGGRPRSEEISCGEKECFLVPRGVVLGEEDGIAFTWVVSNPKGMVWQGNYINPATAGIKTTAIAPL